MIKPLLFALLSATGSLFCVGETYACGRGSCCARTVCATPACAAGVATPAPYAATTVPQANRGSTYQSFSYEPGASRTATPVPMYYTPRPMMRAVPRDPAIHSSDYKVRGGYYPNR